MGVLVECAGFSDRAGRGGRGGGDEWFHGLTVRPNNLGVLGLEIVDLGFLGPKIWNLGSLGINTRNWGMISTFEAGGLAGGLTENSIHWHVYSLMLLWGCTVFVQALVSNN